MQNSPLAIPTALLVLTLVACNHGLNQVAAASSDPSSASPAAQDSSGRSLQIRVSSSHRTYACVGNGVDSVQVTGSSDTLTITGNCGALQVTGSSNTIMIDSVKSLDFTGDSNSVLYRRGPRPIMSDQGQSNSLARATGQMSSPQSNAGSSDQDTVVSSDQSGSTVNGSVDAMVASAAQAANAASESAASIAGSVHGVQTQGNRLNIILSNQQTVQDCGDGKNVNIDGYKNDITLTGSCNKVALNGWGNTVHIEETASIEVMGHTNNLFWQRGRNVRKPAVQIDGGVDNFVRHQTPASQ